MNRNNSKFLIGTILVIGIAAWIFGSVSSENLTYYYTPDEVSEQHESIGDNTIRIMGLVKKESVEWTPRETKLVFQITDDEKHYIEVEYIGAKPDMFREGQGVVVEGKLKDPSHFTASALLVKHSEEYKATDHTGKKEEYYQSLQE